MVVSWNKALRLRLSGAYDKATEYELHYSSVRTLATNLLVPTGMFGSIVLLSNASRIGEIYVWIGAGWISFVLAFALLLNLIFEHWSRVCRQIGRWCESALAVTSADVELANERSERFRETRTKVWDQVVKSGFRAGFLTATNFEISNYDVLSRGWFCALYRAVRRGVSRPWLRHWRDRDTFTKSLLVGGVIYLGAYIAVGLIVINPNLTSPVGSTEMSALTDAINKSAEALRRIDGSSPPADSALWEELRNERALRESTDQAIDKRLKELGKIVGEEHRHSPPID